MVSAHRNFTEGATFVPFSVEIAGGFGPQAERFVETVVEWAGIVHDLSVFGRQATNFERYWMQQIGFLLVRERAKVGSAARRVTGRGVLGARTPWAGWSLVRSK
jgi:hypothetical protein